MAHGTIDQLNFEVILNDTKFDAQIRKDIQLANQLNTSLTNSLNLRKRLVVEERSLAKASATTAAAQQRAQVAIERSTRSMAASSNSFTRAWLRFSATLWSIIAMVRLFTRTIGAAIKNISSFQQANANLATIMQVSRKEIETLTNDALALGRTTEWTASQVTELQTALAKLGYNMPQIRNMQESVLQFATAVGAKLPDAANLAGAALRMFGMHSTETQKVLEILTASTNKTALDFEKLKVALPYVGAIAHSIGFDVGDTSALLGVLANSGLAASRTGTGLRKILLELAKENGKLQTAMGGNIRTFDDFVNGLQNLRDRGLQAGEAQKLVGERAGAALLILANGVDDIRRLNDEVRDTEGLLKDIQAERLDTLHGSTLLLKSAWEGLIQTFRDSAGPMKDIVDGLTQIIRATSIAASRLNRITQGTKGNFLYGTKGIVGSDELTKQFKQHFDSLVKNNINPEEAAQIVEEEMRSWFNGAQDTLIDLMHQGYKETPLTRFFMSNTLFSVLFGSRMNRGREANEQVEAVENAMGNTRDYMTNWAAENAEMAAQSYLEHWKMVFDTEGAAAARAAADAAIKGFEGNADMKKRLEAMKQQLQGYIANGGLLGAILGGKATNNANPFADEISDTRSQIALLEKYKSAFDKLEPYIGEEGAAAWVKENMGYDMANLNEDLEKLIDHLKTLGEEGVEAADAAEARFGLDKASKAVKGYIAAQKALEEYERALGKFDKDWGEGDSSGATFKAEGILRKYTNEKKKIEDEWIDLQQAAAKANREVTQTERDLYEARKRANENTMTEALRGLVDDIFKGAFPGKELSDWSHKTLADIVGIKKAVETMDIPEEIQKMVLEKGGQKALDELKVAFINYKNEILDGTIDPELVRKTAKYAKQLASYISKAGDAMERLGEATDNLNLTDAGKALSAIGQNLNAAAEGYEKSGHWIGAVVGGVVDIFNQVVDAVANANEKMKEMEDTIRNIRIEAESARFDKMLSGNSSTVFGDNFIEWVKNAVTALDQLKDAFKDLADSQRNAYAFTLSLQDQLGGTVEQYRQIIDSRGMPTPGIGDMQLRTGHSFWSGDTFKTLLEISEELGIELEDVNKNLNPKLLEEVLNLYGDLNDGAKDWLTQAKLYSEEYAKALDQIENATKDIFDGLASDMTDQFIDNFLAMGNAVDDLSETFADLGDSILRSFLQSYILDEILGKYQQEAKGVLSAYSKGEMTPDDYAAWLNGFAETVQRESESLAPAINGMIEAFKDRGLMNIDEGTANTLGSGIKSITEDTANLLASYINAIRADVSYIRVMQERGWGDIAALGQTLPTLNDHIARISATNYDIAQSNQRILSELQSVIGAPGTSGMVVRVEAS